MTTKYHRHYQSLIENARNRILPNDTYKESHHIIPRSFSGEQRTAVILMGAIKRYKKCNSHLYESMRLAYITTVKGKSKDIEVREKHRLLHEELIGYNGDMPSVESMKMLNDILYGSIR